MKVVVDGIETSYDIQGSGKVVLLLHGWGSSMADFGDLAKDLSGQYKVIAVDLPGFGQSAVPVEAWDVGCYALFVKEFLLAVEADHIHAVIGHSFGGRIAIKGIATGALESEKLVLIGSAGIKHTDTVRNQAFNLLAKIGKGVFALPFLRSYRHKARAALYAAAEAGDYMESGAMKQVFLNVINEDLREYVAQITSPALLIWGSEDGASPIADARIFWSLMSNSDLKILQGAGHYPHHDQPRKVTRLVREFLA